MASVTIITAQYGSEVLRFRLIGARMKLASLVVEDQAFLPFFKRIENELSRLDQDQDVLERARALAANINPQKATR